MGAMKKLLITCILVGTLVPFFQNCGQQGALHGNGDPYETDPTLGIGPEPTPDLPGLPGTDLPGSPLPDYKLLRVCLGSGSFIKSVHIQAIGGTADQLISITASDNTQRSVVSRLNAQFVNMNIQFGSGVTVKQISVFSESIKLSLTYSGTSFTESYSCTMY